MAERLNPINVGYRPLSPADDVSGLASQRQAVQEFEAKSMAAARSANSTQQAINAGLKAHETFARLAQNAQSLELEREKARHTMEMQESELLMEQRLMPLKLEGLALDNDAQAIDNEYAYAEKEEEIVGRALENEMRIEALAENRQKRLDFANVEAYEKAKRNWVKSERDPDDFVWGGSRGNSRESRMAFDDADRRIKAESRTKEIDAETDALSGKFQLLDDGERDIFDKKDSLADGGGFTYRTKDGKAFNARGKELLDRMDRQRGLNLTYDEKVQLRGMNLARLRASGSGDSSIAAMTKKPEWYRELDGGEMVLTEAGIREFEIRRQEMEPEWYAVSKTGDTVTSERGDASRMKVLQAKTKAFYDSPMYVAGSRPNMKEFNKEARFETARLGDNMPPAQIKLALSEGKDIYLMKDGKPIYLNEIVGPDGVFGTADDTVTFGGSASGGGFNYGDLSYAPTEEEAVVLNQSFNALEAVVKTYVVAKKMNNDPVLYDTHDDIPWEKSYAGGHSPEDWNDSPFVRIKDYRNQLLKPTSWVNPYDSEGKEKGYGATEAEADEIITLIKANALANGLTKYDNQSLRQQANWAVDYYSDKYVNPLRTQLAELLGYNRWTDPSLSGFSEVMGSPRYKQWGLVNPVSKREADEIISTEIGDATVQLDAGVSPNTEHLASRYWKAKRGGKVMTIREFVKLPAAQMKNARLFIPYAEEKWMDFGTPNEPTEGNLHGKGRRRTWPKSGNQLTTGITLFGHTYGDKLGKIKRTLEQIIKNGDELKRLEKFLRYEADEYN